MSSPASVNIPSETTLMHACKLSISEDKAVMFDYWVPSSTGGAVIGIKPNEDKMLVKSEEEYTSPAIKFYKNNNEYIVVTENSIYIVSIAIPTKRVTL